MYNKNIKLKMPQNVKQKNRENLLSVINATNVIIYMSYAILACVVCVINCEISVIFGFIFGTIPLILLTTIPYYFAKVFVNVAEDIHTLVERMPPVETYEEQSQPQNDLSAENEE